MHLQRILWKVFMFFIVLHIFQRCRVAAFVSSRRFFFFFPFLKISQVSVFVRLHFLAAAFVSPCPGTTWITSAQSWRWGRDCCGAAGLRGCGPNSSGHGPCPWPMSMAHGFLKLIWYVTDMSLTCLESHQTVPILDSHSTLPSHLWRDQRRKGQTWRCLDFAWGIE